MSRRANSSTLEIDIHKESDGMSARLDELAQRVTAWEELQKTYGEVVASKKALYKAVFDLAASFAE